MMRGFFIACALVFLASASSFAQQEKWPRYARGAFMQSCVGLKKELASHCGCIIDSLAAEIPYHEFQAMAASGSVASDTRYTRIRANCLATPGQR